MQEEHDIPKWIKKTDKPDVPQGFFERFIDRLMQLIQENEAKDVDYLNKSDKPEVPDGFFDNFSDKLMQKIEAEEESDEDVGSILSQLKLRDKPEVPDGYFNDFAESIPAEEQTSTGRIVPLWPKIAFAAAASVIALFFLFYNPNGTTEEQSDSIAETSTDTEESYDEYLAYLDDDEIIDYIVENDVSIEDSEEAAEEDVLYEYVGDDIEEIYLDL